MIVPEKTTYNSCNVEGMYIAITFDDGPSPELTPRLLDILKERGIKATFFVVGKTRRNTRASSPEWHRGP